MRDTRDAETAAQVLEILAVRYFPEVDTITPPVIEQGAMLEAQLVAIAAQRIIVGQVIGRNSALIPARQVAKLRLELQATARQQPWRDRGVVIRGDVPVERNADLGTAASGAAGLGRQYARLACVADRERDVRQIQYGHATKAQLDVLCCARALACVENNRVTL